MRSTRPSRAPTTRPTSEANVEMIENDLPIPAEAVEELHRRFDAVGADWPGMG